MAKSLEEAMRDAGIEPMVDVSSMTQTEGASMPSQDDGLGIPAFLKSGETVPAQVTAPVPLAKQEVFAEDPAPAPAPVVVNTPVPALAPEPVEDTPAEEPEPASNQPNPNADRTKILRDIGKLGEAEANGQNARPAYFERVAEAARLGAVKEDDAAVLHEVYVKGIAKARGVGYVKMGSEPQQISKLKAMIRFGALPAIRPDSVLADVREHMRNRRDAENPVKKSPADAYLSAARMQLGQPQYQLTMQQIEEALATKAPPQKIEADVIYQFVDGMDKKLADNNVELTDETVSILEAFIGVAQNRIKELGGTTKQQRAAEKLAEKEAKLQAEKTKNSQVVRRK